MLVTNSRLNVEIDRKQVCHHIGYGVGYKPPARILSLVNDYVEHAHQLIEPSYSHVIRDVEWVQGSITFVEDSVIFKSQVVARLLEQCYKVAVFVVTIGEHLEEMTRWLAEDGLMLRAAVLDAIGSEAVEGVADFVQGKIKEAANAQGFVISRRFSPGYCDWNIGQQRMLFRAMNGDTLGVRLTGRCLMIPQKSISGIIGIGLPHTNMENYNPCKTCRKYNCPSRR